MDSNAASADRGLRAEEMAASVATLRAIADSLGAEVVLLRERPVAPEAGGGGGGGGDKDKHTAQFLVRRRCEEKDFIEIRIAVVGNVDAGES